MDWLNTVGTSFLFLSFAMILYYLFMMIVGSIYFVIGLTMDWDTIWLLDELDSFTSRLFLWIFILITLIVILP